MRCLLATVACLATLACAVAPAHAQGCTAPGTQADLARCAFADFEAAGAKQAAALRAVNQRLPKAQQPALRKAQRAYLAFAAAQCDLEATGSAGGSVQQMVRWQCMARLTQARAAAQADTSLGRVTGTQAGDVAVFKRLPYATPPVGALRWAPPRPAQPWAGTRDATRFGLACAQKHGMSLENGAMSARRAKTA